MIRNFFGLVGLIILTLMITVSCSPDTERSNAILIPPTQGDISSSAALDAYRLGGGDEIEVLFYNEPTLSGKKTLDGRGVIDMPLIQEVDIGGLTAAQAAKKIEGFYAGGYFQYPEVTLKILKYRPFYILGEVRQAGKYPFQEKLTVLEAVAMAGGFTYRADQDDIQIVRKTQQTTQKMNAGSNAVIMPGDVIKVPERFF